MAASGPPDPSNPHDALFRVTFSKVEHAAAELRIVLPPALLRSLDLSTLALEPGTYVDSTLAGCESDLLFTVSVAGRPGLVYLLFEHQSSVDELMPLRILKYVVRILERHTNAAGGGKRALPLPVVLPIVVHHSATGWTTATRMEALFDASLLDEPTIRAHVPSFSFVLDDISHLSDDALIQRALGLVPTLTLWALRDARRPGRIASSLPRWITLFRDLLRAETGREALITIFRYLSLVAEDLTPQTLLAALEAAAPEATTVMTTLAEHWKTEGRLEGEALGRLEGEALGRLEGEALGRLEGARLLLLSQLELKFGALSDQERDRVSRASHDELRRWAVTVLTAASITAVLET
jgi:predicted transposase/invertase (TIGR01784 family)